MIFCCTCYKHKYYLKCNIAASLHYTKGIEFWTNDPKSDLAMEYFRTKNYLGKTL